MVAARDSYDGPPAEGLVGPAPAELTPHQVAAYAAAFLEAQGVPRRTIQRAFRVDRKTVYRRLKRAGLAYAEARLRRDGVPPDLDD